jgi:hypothetical protein
VPARQRGEDLRQLLGGGLRGALDAGRNDEDVALEGGFELDPDEVVRVVELATALGVRRAEPLLPEESDEDVTGGHGLGDHFDEVGAEIDRVDVHEDVLGAEAGGESVVEAARVPAGIVTAVTEECPCSPR